MSTSHFVYLLFNWLTFVSFHFGNVMNSTGMSIHVQNFVCCSFSLLLSVYLGVELLSKLYV